MRHIQIGKVWIDFGRRRSELAHLSEWWQLEGRAGENISEPHPACRGCWRHECYSMRDLLSIWPPSIVHFPSFGPVVVAQSTPSHGVSIGHENFPGSHTDPQPRTSPVAHPACRWPPQNPYALGVRRQRTPLADGYYVSVNSLRQFGVRRFLCELPTTKEIRLLLSWTINIDIPAKWLERKELEMRWEKSRWGGRVTLWGVRIGIKGMFAKCRWSEATTRTDLRESGGGGCGLGWRRWRMASRAKR